MTQKPFWLDIQEIASVLQIVSLFPEVRNGDSCQIVLTYLLTGPKAFCREPQALANMSSELKKLIPRGFS